MTAFPLLKLAVKYAVMDLVSKCTELLKKGINDDTALATFEQSKKYGDSTLFDKALDYICRLVRRLHCRKNI